jgi:hypothetical protein
MKKALLAVLALAMLGAVVSAQELQVPGKRVVVVQPGDVVVQAADMPKVARLKIDVGASGAVKVTSVATPRAALKPGQVGIQDFADAYLTNVVGSCWVYYNDGVHPNTACHGGGEPTPRYILLNGTFTKPFGGGESNACAWLTPWPTFTSTPGFTSSGNVTGVFPGSLPPVNGIQPPYDTCASLAPCWVGDPTNAMWQARSGAFSLLIRVELSPVGAAFTVWVDLNGFFITDNCVQP